MNFNIKKIIFSRVALVVFSSIILASVFIFYFSNRKGGDLDLSANYPSIELPLQEVENSPQNYSFSCLLDDIEVKEVEIKHLTGQLFGMCNYKLGNDIQEVALMLGFIDKNKGTTFVFGKNLGLFEAIFQQNAFENLAKQAGIVKGVRLNIVVTAMSKPKENQGVYGIKLLGSDIEALYRGQEDKLVKFSTTGRASDMPNISLLNKVPVILPVSVELAY